MVLSNFSGFVFEGCVDTKPEKRLPCGGLSQTALPIRTPKGRARGPNAQSER